MYNGSKYYMDPELCSQRIVNITKSANIEFLKMYWFLGEGKLMQAMPNIVGIKVQINKVFTLPPEDLKVSSEKLGTMVTIKAPSTHTGKRTVHARLLSSHSRSGMVGERQNCFKYDSLPLSKYLVFYVHGGGFCATTSKTYESCLREWADQLKIPIFAVDYGLAPEAPYPCGLEDVFYAYCWVLKHPELLGFNGERIVFAGDSAGANLITACITKCIETGIKLPDGMMYLYGPSLIKFCSSPSRMMSLIDPLMSHGFLMRCLKAYVGHCKTDSSEINKKFEECKNCEADVFDDDQEEGLTPSSPDQLNAIWERAQMDTEFNTWQTNLSSIREGSEDSNIELLNQPSCSKDNVFEAPQSPTDEKPTKSRSRTPRR
jgi:hormone-sensitive lipase